MPTVREILGNWLREHGYDGLYSDDCGCTLGDLVPCECDPSHCEAGVVWPCPGEAGCEAWDEEHTHIGPKKEDTGE